MTTTSKQWPITARFCRWTMFVNDVRSVIQDGVVISVNLCDSVYRRRFAPLSKFFVLIPWGNNFRHQIRLLKATLCASPLCFGCLPLATLRWQPGRWSADRQDGQRRVPHLYSGQHGHDFSGIGRWVHSERYWWWVRYLFHMFHEVDVGLLSIVLITTYCICRAAPRMWMRRAHQSQSSELPVFTS